MKKLLMVLGLAATLAGRGAPTYNGPVKAEEVRARAGVGHLMEKIRAKGAISVAYLGGSITAMTGWRNLTTDWLRKTYPEATFKEIHAAIGGTGSNLGVFRLGFDVLRHNPDLLFVEFATNDAGAAPEAIWRSMEGIVRQTWQKDPTTDIVFVYTITASMMGDYGRGLCPRAASAMEQLADHYGIPSIGFGPRVAAEVAAGRLVMNLKDAEKATAVPVETPQRDQAIAAALAQEGKVLFAKDGVHPALPGHEFYLKSVVNGFTQMRDSRPADHAAKLARPFVADNMERAKMVEIRPEMLSGSWTKLPDQDAKARAFSGRMGTMWYAHEPGDTLKFKFKGTYCQIYDLLGPDGGQVWIAVDGKKRPNPAPRFDSYCTYHRIATLGVFSGDDGVHEVEIAIDARQPSRQSVAFRLKDPEKELAEPKYQGTKFWPAKIMLIGDLVQ
ncbi:MAG: SGNH/GDSL hydrolase family protein [Kiritimatiellia bacterium]